MNENDDTCLLCGDTRRAVCDACMQHGCWCGQMYCEDYREAGVTTLASA